MSNVGIGVHSYIYISIISIIFYKYYKKFFDQIFNLLDENGVAIVHTIGSVDPPRDPQPWINKYIFPGGYTPSMSEMTKPIEKSGLIVSDVEVLKLHYSLTLRHWKENCIKNKEHIIMDQNEVSSCLVIKRKEKNVNIVNI